MTNRILPTLPTPTASSVASRTADHYLGIEIGGTKLQGVAGKAGVIQRRWRATVDPAGGGSGICKQIEAGLKALEGDGKALALGVGFGGPVDVQTGRIRRSHQVGGWEDFPIADWLSGIRGIPVAIENDANTACLGEAAHGAGVGLDPVFYVTLGSGVGGGLVSQGAIYHGAPPGEAEFGHLRLDRDGATVESRCSGWSVDARIRLLCKHAPQSILARAIGGAQGGEARHLASSLAQGDEVAKQVLQEISDNLAFALSHAVHLFHPKVIILGGGLSMVGEPLRAAVERRLPGFVMEVFHPVPEIRLASLGEDAVPVGALELAARHLIAIK